MNLVKFIEIIISKFKYLIILPVITGGLTFLLVMDKPLQYNTETSIYTGITSNSGLELTSQRVDKIANQAEFNNILSILKSETLYEEISLRLLTQHLLLTKPENDIISEKTYKEFKKSIPDKIKKLVVKNNFEKTYQNLKNSVKQDPKNYIYNLLNFNAPYYSFNTLSTLKVEQVNSSDIIKISYNCDDPGICLNTVKFAADVFMKNYSQIKKSQKNSAVKYFQEKLDATSRKLEEAENKLLNFNISNTIINYYEQTKQVTTQHQEIELRLQEAKMKYESSAAVLKKLEVEISKRFSINLKNVEILSIRNRLVNCNEDIANYEIYKDDSQKNSIDDLHKKKNYLEKRLQVCLDSIYSYNSNSEGVENQKLLSDWLNAVTSYESNIAALKSMKERQIEFMAQFKRYAPLGANIKRIEREISVYENEYLNILNSLNVALQNEQNTEMISNMRIIDEAKLPIQADSKKKLFIIIAVVFTLLFYILGLFLIELMDHRIKTPSLLKKHTGLDVIGAFSVGNKFFNPDIVAEKAAINIFEKIRFLSVGAKKPFIIQILSLWEDAGKNFVANSIFSEIQNKGFSCSLINFNESIQENNKNISPELYYKANKYEELEIENFNNTEFVICILPTIGSGISNSVLLLDGNLSLLVYNSNLTWTDSDKFNTDKIKQLLPANIYAVLSYAEPNNLEEIYGELPKKRSKLRILAKNLLKRFTK